MIYDFICCFRFEKKHFIFIFYEKIKKGKIKFLKKRKK